LKLPYPRDRDIEEAIKALAGSLALIPPWEFTSTVKEELKRRGFFVGLVTEKRIWRVYELMVRRGTIYDLLDVVKESDST